MIIDIIFLLLMLFAVIRGIRKGFIFALFSIAAFIIGLVAALKLSAVVANRLSGNGTADGKWWPLISFVLVFLAVAFLVSLGGKLVEKTFDAAMLGGVNKLAGVVIFILLYSLVFSIFLFYAQQLHILTPADATSSRLYAYIQPLGPNFMNMIGKFAPMLKDIFSQLERFFENVANKVEH